MFTIIIMINVDDDHHDHEFHHVMDLWKNLLIILMINATMIMMTIMIASIMRMIFIRRYDGDDHHLSHATGKILKSHAVTGATCAARHHETRSGTQRMRSTTFAPCDQNVLFDTPCAARHHETRSGTQHESHLRRHEV